MEDRHYKKLQLPPRTIPQRPTTPRRSRLLLLLLLPPLLIIPTLLLSRRLSSALPASPASFSLLLSASAGSSSLRVFQILDDAPFLPAVASVRPGLAALAVRPGAAARQIASMLDRARRAVPRDEWRRTEVRLLESGALRGIPGEAARRVMEECRRALRSSGFVFRDEWARSISGMERGVYAWVAANYLHGTFGGSPQETIGVVEFGKTSTQVTFISNKRPPDEFSYTLKLPRVTYNLYTRSMYQFEQEAAWNFLEKMHENKAIPPFSSSPVNGTGTQMYACIPKGYNQIYSLQTESSSTNLSSHSWGSYSECRLHSLRLLQEGKDICWNRTCEMLSELLINLWGENDISDKLLYTSELFGLFPRASLADLEMSAKKYCEGDWKELQNEHSGTDEIDLIKYCFSSSYLLALLHDRLGIPMERQSVGLSNYSGSASPDWTLGAFILHTVVEPGQEQDHLNLDTGNDSLTYIVLFTIFLLLFLIIFFVWRSQKPQPKMIYDLGQGQYIVTRQSR